LIVLAKRNPATSPASAATIISNLFVSTWLNLNKQSHQTKKSVVAAGATTLGEN
jgi:hypothetical protein